MNVLVVAAFIDLFLLFGLAAGLVVLSQVKHVLICHGTTGFPLGNSPRKAKEADDRHTSEDVVKVDHLALILVVGVSCFPHFTLQNITRCRNSRVVEPSSVSRNSGCSSCPVLGSGGRRWPSPRSTPLRQLMSRLAIWRSAPLASSYLKVTASAHHRVEGSCGACGNPRAQMDVHGLILLILSGAFLSLVPADVFPVSFSSFPPAISWPCRGTAEPAYRLPRPPTFS